MHRIALKIGAFFRSLQMRIVAIIVAVLFVPTILLINYSFLQTEQLLKDKTSSLVQESLRHVGSRIENMAQDIIKISSLVGSDGQIGDLLEASARWGKSYTADDFNTLGSQEVINISRVQNRMASIKNNFFNYNMHVWIFGANGLVYATLDQISDDFEFKRAYARAYRAQAWYRQTIEDDRRSLWIAPFRYEAAGDAGPHISLARVIRDPIRQTELGVLLVCFGGENVRKLFGDAQSGVTVLLSGGGEVVFSSDDDWTGRHLAGIGAQAISTDGSGAVVETEAGKYLVNACALDVQDWRLVSFLPYESFMAEIHQLHRHTVQINTAVFALFGLLCIALILYITNPLRKLTRSIEQKRVGVYQVGAEPFARSDDVSNLARTVEYQFARIDELVKTVFDEQQRKNDLQYEALRAQINPHFLFNTLNSIKWSAMMSGSEHVAKMIAALGSILEVSMNRGSDEIRLDKELELSKCYIFIQNVRYYNKFTLEAAAREDALRAMVPKLILQPCVENSVLHGLGERQEMRIRIEALRQGDDIAIEIRDDGVGIAPERLKELFSGPNRALSRTRLNGIGLWNVDQRIKLKYGEKYGLSVTSQCGDGTRVRICLPYVEADAEEGAG